MSKVLVALVRGVGTLPKKSFFRGVQTTTQIFLSRCQIRFETRGFSRAGLVVAVATSKTKKEETRTMHLKAYILFMLICAMSVSIVAKILSCHSRTIAFRRIRAHSYKSYKIHSMQFINVHFSRADASGNVARLFYV